MSFRGSAYHKARLNEPFKQETGAKGSKAKKK